MLIDVSSYYILMNKHDKTLLLFEGGKHMANLDYLKRLRDLENEIYQDAKDFTERIDEEAHKLSLIHI